MAPDDLKLVRLEARLTEQLLSGSGAQPPEGDTFVLGGVPFQECPFHVGEKKRPQKTTAPQLTSDHQTEMAAAAGQKQKQQQQLANELASEQLKIGQRRFQGYGACEHGSIGELGARRTRALSAPSNGDMPLESQACTPAKAESGAQTPSGLGGSRQAALDGHSAFVERLAERVPCLGIIMALCASLCLGTAGMLVKLTESVHGIQVAVFRAFIQLVIYASIISLRHIHWAPKKGERLPVAMRAILGGLSITFSYYALKLIPLGDATIIRFSLPIWTLIMSYFFLSESCSLTKSFAVFISILGVILVTKPDDCVYLARGFFRLLQYETRAESINLPSSFGYNELVETEELAMLIESAGKLNNSDIIGSASAAASDPVSSSLLPGSATPAQLPVLQHHHNHNHHNHSRGHHRNHSGHLDQPTNDNHQLVVGSNALPFAPPSFDPLRQVEGCTMALASSICLSISIIALRMCKQTPSEVTILWLSLSSILIGSITLVFLGQWSAPDNARDCLYILLNGFCGSLGQWFMTNALKVEQSGLIALTRTFDIEVAFLYSALLLGEQIRLTSVVGSVLVSLGVVIVVLPKWLGGGGGGERAPPSEGGGGGRLGERDRAARPADEPKLPPPPSPPPPPPVGERGRGKLD